MRRIEEISLLRCSWADSWSMLAVVATAAYVWLTESNLWTDPMDSPSPTRRHERLATFPKYCLPAESRSVAHATMSPFGSELQNLSALVPP